MPVLFETVQDWQELMFWRDQEFYDAIEEIEHQTASGSALPEHILAERERKLEEARKKRIQ